jgi:dTDP-4-dehydrorhamnose 3,5-epimerase-like enzyme
VIFIETALVGAFILELERREDDRGFFARAFCQREFEDHGLEPMVLQANVAYNALAGTVRGMHFQFPPHAETKVVRATRGASRTDTRRSSTRPRRATRSGPSTLRTSRAACDMTTRNSRSSGRSRWA